MLHPGKLSLYDFVPHHIAHDLTFFFSGMFLFTAGAKHDLHFLLLVFPQQRLIVIFHIFRQYNVLFRLFPFFISGIQTLIESVQIISHKAPVGQMSGGQDTHGYLFYLRQRIDDIIVGVVRDTCQKHKVNMIPFKNIVPVPEMMQIKPLCLIISKNIKIRNSTEHFHRCRFIRLHRCQHFPVKRKQTVHIHTIFISGIGAHVIIYFDIFSRIIPVLAVIIPARHHTPPEMDTVIYILQNGLLIPVHRIITLKK